MFETSSDLISQLLRDTVAELDIPPDLRAAATREYRRVGNWLAAHADGDAGWVVYPQGSFLLNTVVLPDGHDEYDVDTVCRRELDKRATTQAKLKHEVGGAMAGYVDAHRRLPDGPIDQKERNRCWTLRYDRSLRFHLDVLPATPNRKARPDGILITDRELREWQRSNPLAFAAWFRRQAETEFLAKRARLAEAAHTPPYVNPRFQIEDALLIGVEAADEVLELVVRVALAGLDALQEDHAALERGSERRELQMSTERATVLTHAGEGGVQLGDVDAVADESVERGLPLLHSAVRVLNRGADGVNG